MGLGAAMLSAIFSSPCAVCGEGGHGGRLCDPCFAALPRLGSGPGCALCGEAFEVQAAGVAAPGARCGACLDGRAFVLARSLGRFDGVLQELVVAVKYRGRRSLGYDLGRRAGRELEPDLGRLDTVVALPLGRRRARARGYNQAEVIARGVSAAIGVPLRSGRLRRIRETAPQTTLGRAARRDNVRGAFTARPLTGRVLLVDDVFTTGATVEAAARALRAAGAGEVVVLTLARAARGAGGDAATATALRGSSGSSGIA